MKKLGLMMAATMAATMMGAAAHATTIDFSGHTDGQEVGDTYAANGVTFKNTIFATCGGGCPTKTGNGNFAYSGSSDSFTAIFSGAVSDITFQVVSNSSTLATAYNADGQVVDSVLDTENYPVTSKVDELMGPDITSIVFASGKNSYAPTVTKLTFTPPVSAAPEPGVWALMLAGVAMIGLTLRQGRRQRGMALAA